MRLAALTCLALAACGGGDPIMVRQTVPFGRQIVPVAATATSLTGPASLADAPAADSIGTQALLYRIGESPCAVLRAGLDGLAAGLCGEELRPRVYLRPDRPMRLAELVARYAPFELEVGDEEVELHGAGSEVAGPVERQMVLEWARRLMAEARGVTALRPYRLAFEWQRQLQGGRDCASVSVYLSGEAVATTCDGLRSSGMVRSEAMAAIFAWHERLAPFQAVRQGGGAGDAVSTRLIVPGAGDASQDEDTVKRMIALAESIHGEVLAADLARRQAEEAQIAALEQAALEAEGVRQAAAAPRASTPLPADAEAGELTLSESIAIGADSEQVGEVAGEAGPAEEGEDEVGEGAAAAGEEAVEPAEPSDEVPPPVEDEGSAGPEPDPTEDDGDDGDGDPTGQP